MADLALIRQSLPIEIGALAVWDSVEEKQREIKSQIKRTEIACLDLCFL